MFSCFFRVFLCQVCLGHSVRTSRPNIVIIIVDDLGWNDLGFHGSGQIPTPNIDALAFNGIILNRHYVQQACTPSRSALLTGRYPIHTGMQGDPLLPGEPDGLPLQFRLLPEYLRDLGYRNHIIGKWHLGFFQKAYTPLERGFDSHLGFYNGYTGYYDYIVQQAITGNNTFLTGFDAWRNEAPAWDLVGKYNTDVWGREAVRIIGSHPSSKPLFLYIAHSAVHATNKGRFLEAPQTRVNSFKYILDPNRRTYAAMLSKVDDTVGDVVVALKEKGILDNTIILFMADNGAPSLEHSYPNWGSNFPLTGAKMSLWEGGVRSASFIWSAQLQHAPRVSYDLIHITDWLPTLYIAAGGDRYDLPPDLDGIDQWNTLMRDLPSKRKEVLLNINEKDGSGAILSMCKTEASSRDTWKLITGFFFDGKTDRVFNDVTPSDPPYDYKRTLNSQAYRAVCELASPSTKELKMRGLRRKARISCHGEVPLGSLDCRDRLCLFNLDLDPCETTDMSSNHTDIVQDLNEKLIRYRLGLVPQSNQPLDVSSDPAQFNNIWSPWL